MRRQLRIEQNSTASTIIIHKAHNDTTSRRDVARFSALGGPRKHRMVTAELTARGLNGPGARDVNSKTVDRRTYEDRDVDNRTITYPSGLATLTAERLTAELTAPAAWTV